MRVALSGATGFLGWHLRCALHATGIDTVIVSRVDFTEPQTLRTRLHAVDVVVHAAGMNRGREQDIESTNVSLAVELVAAIHDNAMSGHPVPLVINCNSTHRARDTAYGRSKRQAALLLAAGLAPDRFLDLVLPGVFGEGGQPNYNSVVATFASQLACDTELTVNDNAEIELVHAQDVADVVLTAMHDASFGNMHVQGQTVRVAELAALMQGFHRSYVQGVVPAIGRPFDRALFNTLRSYLFPQLYPIALTPRCDPRGRLVELIKAATGGQMFISSTNPGVTRGDHYHRRKVERFVVVEGTATISLRRMFSDDVVTFHVSGDNPVAIDLPTMYTHNITNVGASTLITLFWSDENFDPENPDTYAAKVAL